MKIDKSFLDEVVSSSEDAAIVRAIVAMAHSLELTTTAEGVEHADQVEFLKANGCDVIQGYFYSRPLFEDDLKAFLDAA